MWLYTQKQLIVYCEVHLQTMHLTYYVFCHHFHHFHHFNIRVKLKIFLYSIWMEIVETMDTSIFSFSINRSSRYIIPSTMKTVYEAP